MKGLGVRCAAEGEGLTHVRRPGVGVDVRVRAVKQSERKREWGGGGGGGESIRNDTEYGKETDEGGRWAL